MAIRFSTNENITRSAQGKKIPERVAVRWLRSRKKLICMLRVHVLSGGRHVRSLTSHGVREYIEDGV